MTDNFDIIRPILDVTDPDDFYHVQIIRRGKDHPGLPSANRTINSYYLSHLSPLEKYEQEIKDMCEYFGARAYINLARRSFRDVSIMTVKALVTRIADGDFKKPYRAWNTACGTIKSKKDTAWVVDVDKDAIGSVYNQQMEDFLRFLRPRGEEKVKHRIPTKSGYHLITNSFNVKEFNEQYPDIAVHRNNPTVLYIPKSLD